VRKADNLPPSCTVVTKSGNLNFLETSGAIQASNGIALTFYCNIYEYRYTISIPGAVDCILNFMLFQKSSKFWRNFKDINSKNIAPISSSISFYKMRHLKIIFM